jgi:hypothetical protein
VPSSGWRGRSELKSIVIEQSVSKLHPHLMLVLRLLFWKWLHQFFLLAPNIHTSVYTQPHPQPQPHLSPSPFFLNSTPSQPPQKVILPDALPSRHATTLDDLIPPLQRHDAVVALDCEVLALLVDGDRGWDVLGEFRLLARGFYALFAGGCCEGMDVSKVDGRGR